MLANTIKEDISDIKLRLSCPRGARQFLFESSPISNEWRIAIQNRLLLLRLPMMNPRREFVYNLSKGVTTRRAAFETFSLVDLPRDTISYPSYRNMTICIFFSSGRVQHQHLELSGCFQKVFHIELFVTFRKHPQRNHRVCTRYLEKMLLW